MKQELIKKYFFNIFGILISRISGFCRDFLLARFLGASIYSDIFFIMIKLPSVFRTLFTEGTFNQSFLPNLAKTNRKGEFCVKILIIFIAILSLIALIVFMFSNIFTNLIAYGFDDEIKKISAPLIGLNIWYLVIIFCASFFASLLNYKGRFFITSISASIFNFACVAALLIFKDLEKLQLLKMITYFILISAFIQVIILMIALKDNKIFHSMIIYVKNLNHKNKKTSLKGFFKNFSSSLIGSSSSQLNSLVEIALASSLAHASISYLNYSTRLYQLPLALIAIAFTQVFFPSLIVYIKQGKIQNAILSIQKIFELMLLLLILAALTGYILSEEIIKLLFERGAFTNENTLECAKVLRLYILCIVPLGISKLFLAWINANYLHSIAAKISIISCFISIIASLCLIKDFGILAFCISANISAWFILLAYLFVFSYARFFSILRPSVCLGIIFISVIFAYVLIYLKGFLNAIF
ncbi:murein biosynthesis integral membrane protein MurJ [Campylobacter sp. RM9333]|uniref:murein biosynthesis integral membrane protein MurJ n=1 Tax=Campylobacter sp. RM9333 TaxID=2735731 RepID=UPI001DE64052|nr:murein biosynthesis integral membrane protein MurJ [Campylobacter sp. RM9333]